MKIIFSQSLLFSLNSLPALSEIFGSVNDYFPRHSPLILNVTQDFSLGSWVCLEISLGSCVSWDLSLELRSDMALGSSKMFLRNIPWVISLLWLGDGSWCRICSHTAILHALTARLQQSSSSWESSCRNRWSVGSVRFGSNLIDLGWFKLDLHGLMAHLMVNGNWFHCFLCDIAVGAALFLLGVLSLNLKSDSEIPWALVFYVMPGWFHPGLGKILLSHCRILLVNALWILDRWALMAILISNGSCSTVFFVIVAIAVPPMCFWLLKWA